MTDARFRDHAFHPPRSRSGWNNRYFIDTEFTRLERPLLISLAIVGESGSEFYGELSDFDVSQCSDFVRAAVLPQLGRFESRVMSWDQMRITLRGWLAGIPPEGAPVLCYDQRIDVDLFCKLIDGPLPVGWKAENICRRLDATKREAFLARHGREHHALYDARANAVAYLG